jgi:hypothetical protein
MFLIDPQESCLESSGNGLRRTLNLALPDNEYVPTVTQELLLYDMVTSHIIIKFMHPEIRMCLWYCGHFASFVTMPEATVNKNGGLVLGQYNVRISRQITAFQ